MLSHFQIRSHFTEEDEMAKIQNLWTECKIFSELHWQELNEFKIYFQRRKSKTQCQMHNARILKAERSPFCFLFLFLEKNCFLLHIFRVKEYKLHGVRNLQLYWTPSGCTSVACSTLLPRTLSCNTNQQKYNSQYKHKYRWNEYKDINEIKIKWIYSYKWNKDRTLLLCFQSS